MLGFINWFKGSLEDESKTASFRRIYNWVLTMLVIFLVVFLTIANKWTPLHQNVLLILLIAIFLNTGVVTIDNIMRFFGKNKPDAPEQVPDPPKPPDLEIKTTVTAQPQQ